MDENIPQIKTIMAHVKQQQEFLLANLNTNHSLQDDFRYMFWGRNNPVADLAEDAMQAYYHDEKYTDRFGIIGIVIYVFYTFKDIYDSTKNEYIRSYIRIYLDLCLDDNLHNLDASILCRTLISNLL